MSRCVSPILKSPECFRRGQSPLSSPASEPSALRRDINLVSDMMVKLSNDSDIDAAYIAKKCQGLTDEQQPVDVEARTNRMREREELFFGDVILTDSKGSVVRMAGKELKQIVRHNIEKDLLKVFQIKPGPVLAKEIQALEEQISREVPIQTFEEFEDEIMVRIGNGFDAHTSSENLTEPVPTRELRRPARNRRRGRQHFGDGGQHGRS